MVAKQMGEIVSVVVPVGWKLVPIQPTPEMLKAVDDEADDKHLARGRAVSAWGLMIDAAPLTVGDEAKGERFRVQPTASEMQPMETAPRDGTHILIKYVVSHYTDGDGRHRFKDYRPVGHKWAEFRFVDGEFRPWAGTDRVNQIGGGGEPVGWAPLPLEANE
jgi:hypothetical protein